MNYKELFNRTILLISSPAKAWDEISKEDGHNLQTTFVYPMIALCGLSTFIGILFGNGIDAFDFQLAMTKCCGVFISLFGGFFLSSALVNHYGYRRVGRPREDHVNCQKIVGYSMVVLFVLDILGGLLPSFFIFRWILQFYIIYVVWEGAKVLMNIPEDKLLSYTIITSFIILGSPALIEIAFNQLSKLVN